MSDFPLCSGLSRRQFLYRTAAAGTGAALAAGLPLGLAGCAGTSGGGGQAPEAGHYEV